MLIRFLYFLLLIQMIQAENIVKIGDGPVNLNHFKMSYFVDTSEKMPFEEIKKQTFQDSNNNITLGTSAHVSWIRINLENTDKQSKKLFIHNAVAYHAKSIHFYEMKDDRLLGELELQPREFINTDKMQGAIGSYAIDLKAGEKKTIYMKSHFLAYQFMEIGIYDQYFAIENLVHRFMPIVIFFSILMTLALYYFILYISSRYKEYLYYALYLLTSAVFLSYTYGMVSHYFHLYGHWGLKLNALAILSPVFLTLFVKYIFKTKENYPLQNHYINSLIIVFTLTYLYSFIHYYQAIEFTSLIFIYFIVVMFWVAISLYRINAPLIKYFLIAHTFYLIFSVTAVLFYNKLIAYTYITSHAIAIGTMIEALMLAFLVSYRITLLELDNKKKEMTLLLDNMTSLYNRSFFDVSLKRELLIHRREQTNLTLFMIDIDFFKQYNDTYGHLEGDKTLIRVAKALQDSLKRSTDVAFRIGGEEFAILFSDMKSNIACTFANKLRESIEDLYIEHKMSSVSSYVTVSIGVYTVPKHYLSSPEQLYRRADSALYEAKSSGRNQVKCYENGE